MPPKYTIAMTTYNCGEFLPEVLESLENFGRQFELVVVDAGSTDRTREIFYDWDDKHNYPFKLEIAEGYNLGEGRQRALELANGEHIIVEIEGDIIYKEVSKVLPTYEKLQEKEPGQALLVTGNNGFVVGPQKLLLDVGYRPLQWREDHSFHDRLYKRNRIQLLTTEVKTKNHHRRKGRIEVAKTNNGDAIVTHELETEPESLEKMKDWFGDCCSLFRIGFSFPQVIRHSYSTMRLHEFLGTIPITSLGYISSRRQTQFNDAMAESHTEIYFPKLHKNYGDNIVIDVNSVENI